MSRVRLRTLLAAIGLGAAGSGAAAGAPEPGSAAAIQTCCAIVELRQYTLHPGRFDAFAQLFDDEFIDPLEAAGMTVIGEFRDLDDPNRFVWLRGFADMPARASALAAFYDGPVWKARRAAANANFTDTDNVLLLHPVPGQGGVPLAARAARRADDGAGGTVVVTVYALRAARAAQFPAFFAQRVAPALEQSGIHVLARFETESSANNFPRLPVREGEQVFVWIAKFADAERAAAALETLRQLPAWRDAVAPQLQQQLSGPTQLLRLAPTPRSRLRG